MGQNVWKILNIRRGWTPKMFLSFEYHLAAHSQSHFLPPKILTADVVVVTVSMGTHTGKLWLHSNRKIYLECGSKSKIAENPERSEFIFQFNAQM